jgi:outer membrane murein-binding lipoprotein Lpp
MHSRRRFLRISALGTLFLAGCNSEDEVSDTPKPRETPETPEPSTPSGDGATLDIRDFGAAVDGQTDDTEAVRSALDAADPGDTVFFPEGTTRVGDGYKRSIWMDDTHSGITLQGTGEDTVIKQAGGHSENNQVLYIEGDTNPRDITIRNLRVDGNRSNNAERTTTGFLAWPSGNTENILVENVWIENCSLNAFQMSTGGVTVKNCTARHNTVHGFAPSSPDPSIIVVRDVLSYDNRMGIDDSSGNTFIDGFVIRDCLFGMKNTRHTQRTIIKNGVIKNCDSVGYRMNIPDSSWPDTPGDVTIDNVVSEGHGDWAFRFDENANFTIGTILARNSNTNGSEPGQIGVLNQSTVTAEDIHSYDAANGAGLHYSSTESSRVSRYTHAGNPGGPINGPTTSLLDIHNELASDVGPSIETSTTSNVQNLSRLDVPTERDVGAR